MQNPVTVFRTLIIASLVLSLAGSIIDLIVPGLVPESLSRAYEAHTAIEASLTLIMVSAAASIGFMVLAVIATIGLLVLQPWARPLALWSSALSFLAYPILGAWLQSGVAAMLVGVGTTLWGAALAMAYFSDLKSHFERRPA